MVLNETTRFPNDFTLTTRLISLYPNTKQRTCKLCSYHCGHAIVLMGLYRNGPAMSSQIRTILASSSCNTSFPWLSHFIYSIKTRALSMKTCDAMHEINRANHSHLRIHLIIFNNNEE